MQAIDRDYYDGFESAVKGTLKQFLPVMKNYIVKKKLQVCDEGGWEGGIDGWKEGWIDR